MVYHAYCTHENHVMIFVGTVCTFVWLAIPYLRLQLVHGNRVWQKMYTPHQALVVKHPTLLILIVFSSEMMSDVSWHVSLKEAILLHLTALLEGLHHGNQRHGQLSTTPHISVRGLLQMV